MNTEIDGQKSETTIKKLCPTRWSARHESVRTLNESWPIVLKALQTINEDSSQKSQTRSEAKVIFDKLNCLETCIMSKLWAFLLKRLNAVSIKLQSVQIDLGTVVELYDSLLKFFETTRDQFDFFESAAIEVSVVKEYAYDKNRQRQRKRQFDESADEVIEMNGSKNLFSN